MTGVFFVGSSETATLTNVFTVNGVPTDPTTASLTVVDPMGTSTTYNQAALTHTGTGAFAKDVTCNTAAGVWSYTWTGTGAVPDVQHGSWTVLEANLAHLYATPEQIKSRLGVGTGSDLELHQACYAASRSIEQFCRRRFWRGQSDEARIFQADDPFQLDLGPWRDLVSVTSIVTDADADGIFEITWAGADYELGPVDTWAGPEQQPYTSIRAVGPNVFPWPIFRQGHGYGYGRQNLVKITGVWGWPAVPAAVSEATRILASELWKMKDAPLGVAAWGEFGAMRVKQHPKVAELLAPYRAGLL